MIKKKLYVIVGLIVVFFLIGYFVKEATSPPKITEIKFSDSMSDGLYKSGDIIEIPELNVPKFIANGWGEPIEEKKAKKKEEKAVKETKQNKEQKETK